MMQIYSLRPVCVVALLVAACNEPETTSGSSTGDTGSSGTGTGVTEATVTEAVPTTGAESGGATDATGSSDTTGSSDATTGQVTISTGDDTTGDATTGTSGGVESTGDTGTSTGDACDTVLCGDPQVCCAAGEQCIDGACAAACGDFGKIDVELGWAWEADDVTVVPLVGDIQGDATPELVINANRVDDVTYGLGEIVALDGATGVELWRIEHDPPNQRFGSHGQSTPALADFSGDGRPDIVYPGRQDAQKLALIHAVDGAGKLLWTGHTADDTPVKIRWDNGAAAVVNLDDDPEAEIAVGGALFDDDGLMVWNQDGKSGLLGTPTDNMPMPKLLYSGGLPTFADLTGDGYPELVTGREAWKISWTPGDPPTVAMTLLWKNSDGKGNDGWPAVADIDLNGTPEVVLVAWPDIKVLDGATGKLWCGVDPTGVMCEQNDALRTKPIAIKGSNLGGPATIADFDGDGRPEAAIAGGVAFAVYDFNRQGEQIVKPNADPLPAAGATYVRWFRTTQDNSSASTGGAAFDFQADGAAEVAYQDECKAYVFDGALGTVQFELLNSSGTIHEYPLIVDADGDGATEIVVVANLSAASAVFDCTQKTPNFTPRKGVFMYRGVETWAGTGQWWTQHTHHVTDVGPDGNVPVDEPDNWTVAGLDNFRQATQTPCN